MRGLHRDANLLIHLLRVILRRFTSFFPPIYCALLPIEVRCRFNSRSRGGGLEIDLLTQR
jgi:hypothetical protein